MTSFPVFPYFRPPLPATFRSLPVLMTSLPVDIRTFQGYMTSFPLFPYYRPPLPVTFWVISGFYVDFRKSVASNKRTAR